MSKLLTQCALVLGGLMFLMQPVLAADGPKVLQVIAVKVKGGQHDAYLAKVKELNAIRKRLDTGGTMRVWRATLAGDATGTLYIGMEHDNIEDFAKASAKMSADAEWQKLTQGMDASGIREMLANSLMVEVTP